MTDIRVYELRTQPVVEAVQWTEDMTDVGLINDWVKVRAPELTAVYFPGLNEETTAGFVTRERQRPALVIYQQTPIAGGHGIPLAWLYDGDYLVWGKDNETGRFSRYEGKTFNRDFKEKK